MVVVRDALIHRRSLAGDSQKGVKPEWPLVKAQQKRPVFIGQFGVMARSSRRGANPLQYRGIRLVPVRLPVGIAYNPSKLDLFASCAFT
jgi:hypothetical protein